MDPVPVPDGHLEAVCKLGKGPETCAYLVFGAAFSCAKKSEVEATIRQRLAEGTLNAQGDNCAGPPTFATI